MHNNLNPIHLYTSKVAVEIVRHDRLDGQAGRELRLQIDAWHRKSSVVLQLNSDQIMICFDWVSVALDVHQWL